MKGTGRIPNSNVFYVILLYSVQNDYNIRYNVMKYDIMQ